MPDRFTRINREWKIKRERRLQELIKSGICVPIGNLPNGNILYSMGYCQPNQVAAQRIRREREKEVKSGLCNQLSNTCKDCRRIFEECCRFNNTTSFWTSP